MFENNTYTSCWPSVRNFLLNPCYFYRNFSRLKIYAVDFDIKSISMTYSGTTIRSNDWLEINDNAEKLYGTRAPFTLLFDDVIKASLTFQSDALDSKRSYNGFLLYFIGKVIFHLSNL